MLAESILYKLYGQWDTMHNVPWDYNPRLTDFTIRFIGKSGAYFWISMHRLLLQVCFWFIAHLNSKRNGHQPSLGWDSHSTGTTTEKALFLFFFREQRVLYWKKTKWRNMEDRPERDLMGGRRFPRLSRQHLLLIYIFILYHWEIPGPLEHTQTGRNAGLFFFQLLCFFSRSSLAQYK